MSPSLLLLSRRHISERRALDVLRRCLSEPSGPGCFRALVRRARMNGAQIQPRGARYMTRDELALLRWLAEAQRQSGLRTYGLSDVSLEACLYRAAGALKKDGITISARSMTASGAASSRAEGNGLREFQRQRGPERREDSQGR